MGNPCFGDLDPPRQGKASHLYRRYERCSWRNWREISREAKRMRLLYRWSVFWKKILFLTDEPFFKKIFCQKYSKFLFWLKDLSLYFWGFIETSFPSNDNTTILNFVCRGTRRSDSTARSRLRGCLSTFEPGQSRLFVLVLATQCIRTRCRLATRLLPHKRANLCSSRRLSNSQRNSTKRSCTDLIDYSNLRLQSDLSYTYHFVLVLLTFHCY